VCNVYKQVASLLTCNHFQLFTQFTQILCLLVESNLSRIFWYKKFYGKWFELYYVLNFVCFFLEHPVYVMLHINNSYIQLQSHKSIQNLLSEFNTNVKSKAILPAHSVNAA